MRAGCSHHQGIAISGRARSGFGAEHTTCTAAVVDDDGLPFPALVQLLRDDTRHDVGRAPRRKRYDEADRLRRIRLGSVRCVHDKDGRKCGVSETAHGVFDEWDRGIIHRGFG
jgi:hypothetical protein